MMRMKAAVDPKSRRENIIHPRNVKRDLGATPLERDQAPTIVAADCPTGPREFIAPETIG